MIRLTIFTPTYNRARYLNRLYDSIRIQDHLNEVEWIIIDDESTDNTKDVVNKIIRENNEKFHIIYIVQSHGGKHRAINRAVDMAKGEFFFIVDSDDYIMQDAIKKIFNWMEPLAECDKICAISGLKILSSGENVGNEVKLQKSKFIDASIFDRYKFGLGGDKAEVYKTSLIKNHKFPEFKGEMFITENVCWDAIAADGYKIRWYNEPIYVCDYLPDGLTRSGANKFEGHRKNFKGYSYYIVQCMKVIPIRSRMAYFIDYYKTTKKMGLSVKESAKNLHMNLVKYGMYIILGNLCEIIKRIKVVLK